MNFLTQRLSYKSGTTPVQLKCGAYILRSELEKAEQYKKLQYKYGYLSKDEAVCSSTNLIKRGWILDVQRLDGTKVPVSVVEKKVSLLFMHYYGVATASPYVAMARKQHGGSNQHLHGDIIARQQMLMSKSTLSRYNYLQKRTKTHLHKRFLKEI